MSTAGGPALGPGPVLHLVVPSAVDDPSRPSGGNVYDRELAHALRALGREVRVHRVAGGWGDPLDPPVDELDEALGRLPGDAAVLLDGLLGLGAPDVLDRVRGRLRVWLLVHLPLGLATDVPEARAREGRALTAAEGVVVTSGWTRTWLTNTYRLDPTVVRVARPGVHPARPTTSRGAGALLCVGAVVPGKGQDVLLDALAPLRDLAWSCRLVGPLDRDPPFVARLRARRDDLGLARRVELCGTLERAAVDAALAGADLVVVPSRWETYGMAATEALAHGVPVVASRTGGLVEAVGAAPGGRVPGLLVPPGDDVALGDALRTWLRDPSCRTRWRTAARLRRDRLRGWRHTAEQVRTALDSGRSKPRRPPAARGRTSP